MNTLYEINAKVQLLNKLNISYDDSMSLDNVYCEIMQDIIQYNKENEIKVALKYNERIQKYELFY